MRVSFLLIRDTGTAKEGPTAASPDGTPEHVREILDKTLCGWEFCRLHARLGRLGIDAPQRLSVGIWRMRWIEPT
jgi:hypothetical protein